MTNWNRTYLRAVAVVMIGGYRGGPQKINARTLRIMFNRYSGAEIDNDVAELLLELMDESGFVSRGDHYGDYLIDQNAVRHAFSAQPSNEIILRLREQIKDIADMHDSRTPSKSSRPWLHDCFNKQEFLVSEKPKVSNVVHFSKKIGKGGNF